MICCTFGHLFAPEGKIGINLAYLVDFEGFRFIFFGCGFGVPAPFLGLLVPIFGISARSCVQKWCRERVALNLAPFRGQTKRFTWVVFLFFTRMGS